MRSTFVRHAIITFFVILLAACGGGDDSGGSGSPADRYGSSSSSSSSGGDGSSSSSSGGTSGSGDGETEPDVVKMGSGIGTDFTENVLRAENSVVQAGASTRITANLVDEDNVAVTAPYDVSFSSDCVANGLAFFHETTVTTDSGRAAATYTANGCAGMDTVRAEVMVNGVRLTATVEITVEADEVLSLRYEGSERNQLALPGMGGDETTRVSFKLVGAQGAPIRNEDVTFSLSKSEGGVRLVEGWESAVSDDAGLVTTIVQSGTISTTVRVTATHDATGRKGLSEHITISTGVPVDSHFSVTVSEYNPSGAYAVDGIPITVSVIASDQYGNDALDGTQISFWSPESGNIDANCILESGQCSATWISSSPRPLDDRLGILVFTNGAEDFGDVNGNNVYDGNDSGWTDVVEPWINENENINVDGDPIYDIGEHFVDENANGVRDTGDNFWNGPCLTSVDSSALCPGDDSVMIWEMATVVMPEDGARIHEYGDFPVPPDSINIAGSDFTVVDGLIISDSNSWADPVGSNPLPAGAEISFETSNGSIFGATSYTVPNNAIYPTGPYSIILEPDDEPSSGLLVATVKFPSGVEQILEMWEVVD